MRPDQKRVSLRRKLRSHDPKDRTASGRELQQGLMAVITGRND
jgi:hypothetical protein